MKKLSFIVLFFTTLVITGCSQQMELTPPTDEVILEKNVPLGEGCWDEAYKPLHITDQDKINNLFDDLNEWKYKEERFKEFDLCGYQYVITWNDNAIRIIGENYFYMDGKLYKLTNGNIDFLDNYEFELDD